MNTANITGNRHRTILIGSSGAGNAFAAVMALRRNWGESLRIISADSNSEQLVTASLLSDKFYQVPKTTQPKFMEVVTKISLDENIDTYIPFIDDEIYRIALLYEKGMLNEKVNIQVRSSKIADLCNDKYKTFLWLSEMNIMTPECYTIDTPITNSDSLILKPRRGYGSTIRNVSEINDLRSNYDPECYIIQHKCEYPEITIDVCYDKNRDFFIYVCRERLEVKSGVCTKARLHLDKDLEEMALTIASKLDLSSYCFQVMKYKNQWAVTDINARLGAGTAMSTMCGMDFFSGMFAILWGEDPSFFFRPLLKETFVTRQYSEFIMNL